MRSGGPPPDRYRSSVASRPARTSTDWGRLGFVRVSAVAPPVAIADPAANATAIAAWARRAAEESSALVCFPELALTGYTCEDLFLTSDLHHRTDAAIESLCAATADLPCTIVVGAPLHAPDGRRYNAALVLQRGRVHGAVPKIHLPNAAEFYERRWFVPGGSVDTTLLVGGLPPFRLCASQLFRAGALTFGIEVCEDLWSPEPPSGALALGGALVVLNPSASNELVAKSEYRRDLVRQQSARTIGAYVYAGSGPTESTKDLVFGGHTLVAENGTLLAEGERFVLEGTMVHADLDLDRITNERGRNTTWSTAPTRPAPAVVDLAPAPSLHDLRRTVGRTPFVPDDPRSVDERAHEILAIQATGLARRLLAAHSERAVIGVSGGLDSTLALLVSVEAMRRLGRDNDHIVAITMPGFGTTVRTRSAADELMARLGVDARTIAIGPAVEQHFRDIGHPADRHDVVFENSQARERTQILFDVANQVNGIVVGTGDLSELALGWATYNADHMGNYGVNAAVPKTLVRHLVRWWARTQADDATREVLLAIADTPVSPELLPPDEHGEIAQLTEEVVGPYELHDFFLFHTVRNGFEPHKVRALARHAFDGAFDHATIDRWLRTFLLRFHRQQFKRTTLPPGPKIGSVSLSPRGDLRMPDEVDPTALVAFLDDPAS